MESPAVEQFFKDPIVTWFAKCLKDSESLRSYEDLVNGVLLHEFFQQIHPEPWNDAILTPVDSTITRVNNLQITLRNIQQFYEEELNHLILKLPNIVKLAENPATHIEDMKLLLLLLLGCAVQCPNNEKFVTKIMELDVCTQHAMMDYIKQVKEDSIFVLTSESLESADKTKLFSQISDLMQERNAYHEKWKNCILNERKCECSPAKSRRISGDFDRRCSHNCSVEVADWKSKARKHRQELEEKQEALAECVEQLERSKELIAKLKQDNQALLLEARHAKSYRDEMDALRERAELANRLETEVEGYREKLVDTEFYKTRIAELEENNQVLIETRDMLEEQVCSLTKKTNKMKDIEFQLKKYRTLLEEMSSERSEDVMKYVELYEENSKLRLKSPSETQIDIDESLQEDEDESMFMNSSLSEQIANSDMSRVLKLELENRRLQASIQSVQKDMSKEKAEQLSQLEEENKKLATEVESLKKENEKLKYENQEFELVCKEMMSTNKKLQTDIENQTVLLGKHRKELEFQSNKKCNDLKAVIKILETKQKTAQQTIRDYRRTVEKKEAALEASNSTLKDLESQVSDLQLEVEYANAQVSQLQEIRCEREKALAKTKRELKDVKTKIHQLNKMFLECNVDVDKILTLPANDISKVLMNNCFVAASNDKTDINRIDEELGSKLESRRSEYKEILSANTELQVRIVTLESEISTLKSSQTVLQTVNSNLSAEREELMLELAAHKSSYEKLCRDQDILHSLHEQLSKDHDDVLQSRETIKAFLRQARSENCILHDTLDSLQTENDKLRREQSNTICDTERFSKMNREHTLLKEDFVLLHSTNEKLNNMYKTLKEDHDRSRVEMNRLIQKYSETQSKLDEKVEKYQNLEIDFSKLYHRCELLLHLNSTLEEDRRLLMDHVSQIFDQYHQLLTQSKEDKEHFHQEEKVFTDEINRLCRQKDQLEEKIMEYYKKMENCSVKKKGFGANLVSRMRKASSELLNKSRRGSQDSKNTSPTSEIDCSENEYEMFNFPDLNKCSTYINGTHNNQKKFSRSIYFSNESFSPCFESSPRKKENKQMNIAEPFHHSTLIRNTSPVNGTKQYEDDNKARKDSPIHFELEEQKDYVEWKEVGCV